VRVLMVQSAWRAVGQRARRGLAIRIAAVGIEPLDGARDIRESDAILRVGVELRPIANDQPRFGPTLAPAVDTMSAAVGQR
jgi:hypothetical protein